MYKTIKYVLSILITTVYVSLIFAEYAIAQSERDTQLLYIPDSSLVKMERSSRKKASRRYAQVYQASADYKKKTFVSNQHAKDLNGYHPSNFVIVSLVQQYMLAVDMMASKIYVYSNMEDDYQLVSSYDINVSKDNLNEVKEDEQNILSGLYYIKYKKPKKKMTDRYALLSFVNKYLKEDNKLQNKSNQNIVLQMDDTGGNDKESSNKVNCQSICILLKKDAFNRVSKYIKNSAVTPIVIDNSIDWVEKTDLLIKRKNYIGLVNKWKTSLEKLDVDEYLSQYSDKYFKSGNTDYESWAKRKRSIIKTKKYITLDLANISVYEQPGEKAALIITFDQSYRSNNYSDILEKKQVWHMNEKGKWKIVHEI